MDTPDPKPDQAPEPSAPGPAALSATNRPWPELGRLILSRPERRRLTRISALVALAAVMEAAGLAAIYPFLNALVQQSSSLPARPGALPISVSATAAGLFLLGFYLVKDAFVGWVTFRQYRAIADARTGVTGRAFRHFLRETFARHSRRDLAEVQRTVHVDAAILVPQALAQCLQLLADVLVVSLMLAVLVIIRPAITLGLLAITCLAFAIWHLAVRRPLTRHGADVQVARRDMIGSIISGLRSFKEARVLSAEAHFENRLDEGLERFGRAESFNGAMGEMPRLIMETIMITALVVGGLITVKGGNVTSSDVATIGVFAAAALRVVPSLSRVARATTSLRYSKPGLCQLADVMDEPPELDVITPIPANYEAIELDGVQLTYPGMDSPAIADVSIRIERGEVVSVMGPSGSGKTTLMDVMLGLLTTSTGTVEWEVEGKGRGEEAGAATLAYVPQTPYIESGSVRENLVLGLAEGRSSDEALWEALESVGLADDIRAKGRGLDFHVGEAGSRLSGGQRQRLALARSLARGAHFIILDEPTAALDARSAETVMSAWRNLGPDTTIIVVTHDPQVAARTERMIELRSGHVIADPGPRLAVKGIR